MFRAWVRPARPGSAPLLCSTIYKKVKLIMLIALLFKTKHLLEYVEALLLFNIFCTYSFHARNMILFTCVMRNIVAEFGFYWKVAEHKKNLLEFCRTPCSGFPIPAFLTEHWFLTPARNLISAVISFILFQQYFARITIPAKIWNPKFQKILSSSLLQFPRRRRKERAKVIWAVNWRRMIRKRKSKRVWRIMNMVVRLSPCYPLESYGLLLSNRYKLFL